MGRIVALVNVSTRVALYYRVSTATQATENQRHDLNPIAITSGVVMGLSQCVTAACEARCHGTEVGGPSDWPGLRGYTAVFLRRVEGGLLDGRDIAFITIARLLCI